jgi:hypothetical protein
VPRCKSWRRDDVDASRFNRGSDARSVFVVCGVDFGVPIEPVVESERRDAGRWCRARAVDAIEARVDWRFILRLFVYIPRQRSDRVWGMWRVKTGAQRRDNETLPIPFARSNLKHFQLFCLLCGRPGED